ncbi:MAG: FAD-dependent oxidoreductase, partial [Verrucomicrobia bacterium]|nr:FAD-dependent oxidoreductase [Verrucomicrobiota bacterium]
MTDDKRPQIVVLGGGFGGLTFCQVFSDPRARVTLIDRQNHHLFQPLLYQVATAGLSAPEIAQPIRSILADRQQVEVRMDEVVEIRPATREVITRQQTIPYDYLVIALGGVTTYFGHPEWEAFAPGLKTLEDAVRIRRKVLLAFEQAETATDPAVQRRLMTMVVVGGGPTGVELAGALVELARTVLHSDFRNIDPGQARIILIEASPVVLSNFPDDLAADATETLRRMGVEVHTSRKVKSMSAEGVELD